MARPRAPRKTQACSFADHLSPDEGKTSDEQRREDFTNGGGARRAKRASDAIAENGFYRAYFRLWNEQDYYQAHDVLEHIWLKTTTEDAHYFKGLIQAAGAFVHLKKQFEHPTHPKHGRRLQPAVRLFHLALKNLSEYGPVRHAFDVAKFRCVTRRLRERNLAVGLQKKSMVARDARRSCSCGRKSFRKNQFQSGDDENSREQERNGAHGKATAAEI